MVHRFGSRNGRLAIVVSARVGGVVPAPAARGARVGGVANIRFVVDSGSRDLEFTF